MRDFSKWLIFKVQYSAIDACKNDATPFEYFLTLKFPPEKCHKYEIRGKTNYQISKKFSKLECTSS